MPIRTRIALGFATVLLLTVVVAAIGWNGLATYARWVVLADRTASLDDILQSARLAEARFVERSSSDAATEVQGLSERLRAEGEALAAEGGGEDRQRIADVLEGLAAYRAAFDRFVELDRQKREKFETLWARARALEAQAGGLAGRQADFQATALAELRRAESGNRQTLTNLDGIRRLSASVGEARTALAGSDRGRLERAIAQLTALNQAMHGELGEGDTGPIHARLVEAVADARTRAAAAPSTASEGVGEALARAADVVQRLEGMLVRDLAARWRLADQARESLEMATSVREIAVALIRDTFSALLGLRQYLADGTAEGKGRLDAGIEAIRALNVQARDKAGDATTLRQVDALSPVLAELEGDYRAVLAIGEEQGRTRATMGEAAATVSARVAAVVARQHTIREEGRAWAGAFILLGAGGALALGMALSAVLARGLTRPISLLTRAILKLAEGDVTVGVPGTGRSDELGAIARAIDEVIRVLNGLRQEMLRLSGTGGLGAGGGEPAERVAFHGTFGEMVALLAETGHTFRAIGDQAAQVAVAAGAASTAVAQVSEGAGAQTDDLDRVAALVSQSARAIQAVSESARGTSEMVKAAAAFAGRGKDDMVRMLRVAETIAENSRRIGRITEAITQIAIKTNILSVNASIEAARAGEAGRGFEVVADEVGKLADGAVEATRQIHEIIEAAMVLAEEGMEVSRTARRMMDELAERVGGLDRTVHAVAQAMEEQRTSVRDIETNLHNLRLVAQRNTAASEEIAATMVQLSRLADETRRQAGRFTAG